MVEQCPVFLGESPHALGELACIQHFFLAIDTVAVFRLLVSEFDHS